MKLRISTRDSRAPAGLPVALIDTATNTVVLCFRSVPAATRAGTLLEEVGVFAGREFSAKELSGLMADAASDLFGRPGLGDLTARQSRKVVDAVRLELRRRKQLSNRDYWGE